jgi:microcystin-dependent protein
MSNPFVGEIRMFGGNFAPLGWAFCDGQLLAIAENDALFALIGTTYGGDGQSTFALPDLRGRIPLHQGQGSSLSPHYLGEHGGAETVTLTTAQLPNHTHRLASGVAAMYGDPSGASVADTGTTAIYGAGGANVDMAPAASVPAGGSQPHNNLMPYQCVNFIISLFGIFPSQS